MEHSTHYSVLGVFKVYFHKDKLGITEGYHETVVEITICSAWQKREQISLDLPVIGLNDKMQNNFFLLVGKVR